MRDIDSNHRLTIIGTLISQHSAFIGLKGHIDLANKKDISEMIKKKYLNLSIEDFQQALQMERYGELGVITNHFNLINSIYISTVLDKYKSWLQETRIKNNFPISVTSEKKILEEKEKLALIYNGVILCYKYYLKNEDIEPSRMWVYDHLYDMDLLETNNEKKKQIYELAKSRVKRSYKAKKASNLAERSELKHKLAAVMQDKAVNEFKAMAKKISLMMFFGEVRDSNDEITKFIKR